MSDGGFDPDEMIARTREEENLFGIAVDTITKQYVSYAAVPKSNKVEEVGDDFSKKPGQPQNWTLAGENRENVAYKWVARGSTYPVKELLKKAGMRWDPKHREWHSHKKPGIEIEGIYMMKTKA
ncbi:hypothetical protein MSMTP_0551 [Methanosarcina sp. MTP4]|uniref:hypothetical protein n=1 Tax=Methanosarcina sp. MTP4 TaxID=1434100 RepID=UPI0006158504|nr:hypothetical protein [Methanosarcina sp. MTP4]AKB24020.1 hypothetical protein MSMTP_0551 [Methanosarcina sp. MTP4]